MKKYDTVDFALTAPMQPSLTTFHAADGSRVEVLNESTGSYRIVKPNDPVPHYGRAVEIVYQSSLAREFFAQRAMQ